VAMGQGLNETIFVPPPHDHHTVRRLHQDLVVVVIGIAQMPDDSALENAIREQRLEGGDRSLELEYLERVPSSIALRHFNHRRFNGPLARQDNQISIGSNRQLTGS